MGFTGSVGAGLALWERANARGVPIPYFGELGSANPLVVTSSAAAERGTEIGTGLAGSMTLGVGQFCTKPGLVFVPSGEDGDALVAATVDSLSPLGSLTMLSSSIADHFRRGAENIAAISDVRALVQQDSGADAHSPRSCYREVDAARFGGRDAYALREECFGPLALIVRYDGDEELRRRAPRGQRTGAHVQSLLLRGRSRRPPTPRTRFASKWSRDRQRLSHRGRCQLVDAARRSVAFDHVERRHVGRGGGDRTLAATGHLSIGARRTACRRPSKSPTPSPFRAAWTVCCIPNEVVRQDAYQFLNLRFELSFF